MGARAREKEEKIERRIEENISIIVTIHLTVVLMLNRSSPNPPSHLKVKTMLVHLKLNRMPQLKGITILNKAWSRNDIKRTSQRGR